jgi:hypothetical protein
MALESGNQLVNAVPGESNFNIYFDDDVLTNYKVRSLAEIQTYMYAPAHTQFFVLVRQPVDKMVSDYFYLFTTRNPVFSTLPKGKDVTFQDFTDMKQKWGAFHTHLNEYCYYFNKEGSAIDGEGVNGTAAIAQAKADNTLFGLTEEMDETQVMLAMYMGWDVGTMLQYQSMRKLMAYPKKQDLRPEVLAQLIEATQPDQLFYDYGVSQVAQQKLDLGDAFLDNMAVFNELHIPEKQGCDYSVVNVGEDTDGRIATDCVPVGLTAGIDTLLHWAWLDYKSYVITVVVLCILLVLVLWKRCFKPLVDLESEKDEQGLPLAMQPMKQV